MKSRLRIGALLSILAITVLPLMADTKIVHRWVLTGVPMPRFQKMLVASIMENYLIRQEFEDEMEKLLEKYSVEGIQSYLVLPPRNEMMEGELKQLSPIARFLLSSVSLLFLPLIFLGTARANSCARQLRGFCFPGSSRTT